MIKARETRQLGHDFVEVDIGDYPNITITEKEFPRVLVRSEGDVIRVNVVAVPGGRECEVLVNNKRVVRL